MSLFSPQLETDALSQLRVTLATGWGLPRAMPRPQTVSEEWAARRSVPGPTVSHVYDCTLPTGENRRTLAPLNGGGIRSIDFPYSVPLDEFGEPITSLVPGSEIDIAAYRRAEQEYIRLRGYVPGWADKGMTERFFGPPETRFRRFSQDPYFPDTSAFVRVGLDRTRWNDYRL